MQLKAKIQTEDYDIGDVMDAEITSSIASGKIGLRVWSEKGGEITHYYASLAELNEEWEDYEEPEEWWTISGAGYLWTTEHMSPNTINDLKQIGNYFETEKEAEKAVEKLKAWKRLKDKGFRFDGCQGLKEHFYFLALCDRAEMSVVNRTVAGGNITGFSMDDYHDCMKDLDLLFGGEK